MTDDSGSCARNFWCPNTLWGLVKEESSRRGISIAAFIQEQLWKYFETGTHNTAPIKVEPRFNNALKLFKVLRGMMDEEHDFKEFYISYPDVLYIVYGRWGMSKNCMNMFSKMLRALRHPFQYEAVITEMPIPGTDKKVLSKDGFGLKFECPLSLKQLNGLEIELMNKMQDPEFINRLASQQSDEIIRSRDKIARDVIMNMKERQVDSVEEDEGFDTIQ